MAEVSSFMSKYNSSLITPIPSCNYHLTVIGDSRYSKAYSVVFNSFDSFMSTLLSKISYEDVVLQKKVVQSIDHPTQLDSNCIFIYLNNSQSFLVF
jgi:hypothetical protein